MLRPCVTVRDLSAGMSPPGSRPLRAREAFSVPVPRPPPGAWPRRGRGQSGGGEKVRGAGNTIYRGCMGMLILIVLAAIALFLIVSAVISALHFLFWIAVLALIAVVGFRLVGGARRWSRRLARAGLAGERAAAPACGPAPGSGVPSPGGRPATCRLPVP